MVVISNPIQRNLHRTTNDFRNGGPLFDRQHLA
jgi:hypothetical protein